MSPFDEVACCLMQMTPKEILELLLGYDALEIPKQEHEGE